MYVCRAVSAAVSGLEKYQHFYTMDVHGDGVLGPASIWRERRGSFKYLPLYYYTHYFLHQLNYFRMIKKKKVLKYKLKIADCSPPPERK